MNLPQPNSQPLKNFRVILTIFALSLLAACSSQSAPPTPTPLPPLAKELTFYYWADYFPQSVLESFTSETGVKVNYVTYESYDEAVANIKAGQVYDVAIIAPEQIPALSATGKLAQIDHQHVPNFKNISANFRDLSYDPGNRYSLPYVWGSSGLLVRTDLVKKPITRWADLWEPELAGKVAIWPIQTMLLPLTVKSMGYPANTEEPEQLQAALQRMLALKQNAIVMSNQEASVVPVLESGQAVIAVGWAYDALLAQESSTPIEYILPQEGSILWGENYIIPASSPHPYTAELFLDFVLRPEISARIVEETFYAVPNDAALPLIKPEVRNNPLIFPPTEALKDAYIILPLSPEGQKRWDEVWERFMAAKP